MKPTILFFSFLLLIPLVLAIDNKTHGGEIWTYHFDKCDILKVNITGNLTIDEGEYTILNNCTKNQTNYYICECNDDYDFNVTFKINTINNYTFNFNAYSKVIEEQQSSGGGGSSSRSRTKVCTPDWNCTGWGNCQSNSRATRECNDLNECNATRPSEKRYCYYYVPKIISVEAQEETEVIEQPLGEQHNDSEGVMPVSQVKGLLLGWWMLGIIVIIMVIMIIVFVVKRGENE